MKDPLQRQMIRRMAGRLNRSSVAKKHSKPEPKPDPLLKNEPEPVRDQQIVEVAEPEQIPIVEEPVNSAEVVTPKRRRRQLAKVLDAKPKLEAKHKRDEAEKKAQYIDDLNYFLAKSPVSLVWELLLHTVRRYTDTEGQKEIKAMTEKKHPKN